MTRRLTPPGSLVGEGITKQMHTRQAGEVLMLI
jgi:hypothetical protein